MKIEDYLTEVQSTIANLNQGAINNFVTKILETYEKGGTIFVFGNGGSGATASHFVGDFLKGVSYGLKKRFKAICLNDNAPAYLAIANDISYEEIFREQLKNFLTEKDLVVGISGSGNSPNVINAIEFANKTATTVGLSGFDGGKLKRIAQNSVHVPIMDMEITEDVHTVIIHYVKRILMEKLEYES